MFVLILVAVWIAILTPVAIQKFRERDANRSIVNFHERMATLGSRGEPIVEPAHRLTSPSTYEPAEVVAAYEPARPQARLRVVPEGATEGDLQRELTWDEWSAQFLDDAPAPRRTQPTYQEPAHAASQPIARADAYARVPNAPREQRRAPITTVRAQRARRRQILLALLVTAVVTSLAAFVINFVVLDFLAFASWFAMVGYLGLMYYAMSVGMIETVERPTQRLVNPRQVDEAPVVYNEFDYAYEPSATVQFARHDDEPYAQAL